MIYSKKWSKLQNYIVLLFFNGQSLLESLNDLCFEIENLQELLECVKEDSEFNNYLITLLEYERLSSHKILTEIISKNEPIQWRAHYTWLFLNIMQFTSIYYGYKNKYLEYIHDLDGLMDGVIELEYLHIKNEIPTEAPFSIPQCIDLTNLFGRLLQNRFYLSLSHEEITICEKKQNTLLMKWLDALIAIPAVDSPEAIEKHSDIVLAALFEIVDMPIFSCTIETSRNQFEQLKSWLNQRPLTETQSYFLEMLDFQYYDVKYRQDPQNLSIKFKKLCQKYLSVPQKKFRLESLLKILANKLRAFKEIPDLPEYRDAYRNFLNLTLTIGEATPSNSEQEKTVLISMMGYIDFGIDHKILVEADSQFIEQFDLIKQWVKKGSSYFIIPLELDELILKAPQ